MQQQVAPAGAARPAENLNAFDQQNGDLVARDKPPGCRSVHRNFNIWLRVVLNTAKADFTVLCQEITVLYRKLEEYIDDQESYNSTLRRVHEVKAQMAAMRSWRARSFNTVELRHSVSWDSGIDLYRRSP